jgi:hypothetical protein
MNFNSCMRQYFRCAFFLMAVMEAEAKRRKKSARNQGGSKNTMQQVVWIALFFIVLVIAPVVVLFIYKVAKDPATPDILRALWEKIKTSGFGYLGKTKKKRKKKYVD